MNLESFTAGADYRHMQGAFDELDWNTTCPGANCGKFLRKIWSGGDQALSGAFAQAVISPLTPLHIEASARVDHWDNTDALSVDSALASTSQNTVTYPSRHSTTFNPRVGVRYQALSNLSFYTAVYFAFRAPNLAELYRKQINASGSQITLPNPTLAPERGLGREIGFTFAPLDWANLKGTYYQAEYKDFNVPAAQPVATCGGAPVTSCRQRQNISGARSEGIEATLAVRPIAPLLLSASVNYDDVRQQTNIDTFTVKPRVNRVPSPKQAIKATYTDAMYGTWNAIWRHEGHTTTLQGLVLDPYSVLDGSVQREITRGYTGFVAVENLTDVKYQVNQSGTGAATIMSYGLPRTVRIGVMLDR
jgi:outer membrane receptor protein involved in Fe transport